MSRKFTCDGRNCHAEAEIPSTLIVPKGWERVTVSTQYTPQKTFYDLCPACLQEYGIIKPGAGESQKDSTERLRDAFDDFLYDLQESVNNP